MGTENNAVSPIKYKLPTSAAQIPLLSGFIEGQLVRNFQLSESHPKLTTFHNSNPKTAIHRNVQKPHVQANSSDASFA
jgi:hypothetical protein